MAALTGTLLFYNKNREFIYVADGANFKAHTLKRDLLEALSERRK